MRVYLKFNLKVSIIHPIENYNLPLVHDHFLRAIKDLNPRTNKIGPPEP